MCKHCQADLGQHYCEACFAAEHVADKTALHERVPMRPSKPAMCAKHGEAIKLYCHTDKTAICLESALTTITNITRPSMSTVCAPPSRSFDAVQIQRRNVAS